VLIGESIFATQLKPRVDLKQLQLSRAVILLITDLIAVVTMATSRVDAAA
jgi:hypothetical protein